MRLVRSWVGREVVFGGEGECGEARLELGWFTVSWLVSGRLCKDACVDIILARPLPDSDGQEGQMGIWT